MGMCVCVSGMCVHECVWAQVEGGQSCARANGKTVCEQSHCVGGTRVATEDMVLDGDNDFGDDTGWECWRLWPGSPFCSVWIRLGTGLHLALICPQSSHDTLLPSLGSEPKDPSEISVVQAVRDGRPGKVNG